MGIIIRPPLNALITLVGMIEYKCYAEDIGVVFYKSINNTTRLFPAIVSKVSPGPGVPYYCATALRSLPSCYNQVLA